MIFPLDIRKLSFIPALFVSSLLQGQCVLINEIMINPDSPFDGDAPNTAEWVELYNPCPEPQDIGCYVMADGDFTVTIPAGTFLAPGEFYTIGSANSGFVVDLNWATCGCTSGIDIGIFTNSSGEQLALLAGDGSLADAVVWNGGNFPLDNFSAFTGGCDGFDINLDNPFGFTALETQGGDGCSWARTCDGGGSWEEKCGGDTSPGAANGLPLPMVAFISTSQDICTGECIDFDDQSIGIPISWNWIFEGSETPSANSPAPGGICYLEEGDYDVTLEVSNACGTSTIYIADYIHVSSPPSPVVAVDGPLEFCEGGSVTLSTGSPGIYSWLRNGLVMPGESNSSIIVSQSGTYILQVISGGCIAESEPIEVNVITEVNPTITPSGNIEICEGTNILLETDEGFDSYQWFYYNSEIPGATTDNYTATSSGAYSVYATDGSCFGTSPIVTITVVFVSQLSVTANDLDICEGETVPLTATGGFDSYQWQRDGVDIAGAVFSIYDAAEPGSYSLTAANGPCEGNAGPVIVDMEPMPSMGPAVLPDINTCDTVAEVTAITTAPVQWFSAGQPIAGATNNLLQIDADGIYHFEITSGECTWASDEFEVTLLPALELEILVSDTLACEGDAVELSLEGDFDEVLWSNGDDLVITVINSSGTYNVNVVAGDCTGFAEISISLLPLPEVYAGEDFTTDCGEPVALQGIGEGSFAWYYNDAFIDSGAVILVDPKKQQTYELRLTDSLCTATDFITVSTDCNSVFIPNSFTPDGDGINDEFHIFIRGAERYRFQVFNRWGDLVFESTDPNKPWTGGKHDYYAPDGVYLWKLEAFDYLDQPMLSDDQRQGTVTIVR